MTILLTILIISIIFIILFLMAIAPKIPKRDITDSIKDFYLFYYAHRGLFDNKNSCPENSLAAFKHAVDKGYGIELDVQLTKDNKVIVFHDDSLFRMCGIEKTINEMTYNELSNLRLLGTEEKIPLLTEVLEIIAGRVPLIIEIKLPNIDAKVCSYINDILLSYTGSYCIESFNPLVLRWYKKNHPNVIRGQLSGGLLHESSKKEYTLNLLLSFLTFNFLSKPDFIAYYHFEKRNISLLINKYLFRTSTVAWTIKSQNEYENCKYFFDIFIFDSFNL